MDNNGVPRLRRPIADRVYTYYRVFPDESHPRARYAYTRLGSSFSPDGMEMVVLDRHFEHADALRQLPQLQLHDGRDGRQQPPADRSEAVR